MSDSWTAASKISSTTTTTVVLSISGDDGGLEEENGGDTGGQNNPLISGEDNSDQQRHHQRTTDASDVDADDALLRRRSAAARSLSSNSLGSSTSTIRRRMPGLGAIIEEPEGTDGGEHRGQWSGRFDFLMSMIAYAVGLGNVWRFPYLCFKNGGGSFLVVYAVFFVFAAVPIFIMEVTVGQYLQRGAMEMWQMLPIMKGVGIGNVVISFMCIWYYCVIVAWAVFYMVNSFASTFPWETCNNPWNNELCVTGREDPKVIAELRANLTRLGQTTETAVEQFWERRVLMLSPSISDFGGIQWELLGLTFLAWIVVYFALWKGITQATKFVYFCALFPYFLIAVLLVRGLTLEGAWTGISFYLTPNITKLAETTVWKDAGTQVFYSYGVGFGTLIALGSHNKFNHNCYRDAVTMCFINGMTSILAGFAVFSILGHMSFLSGKSIADIVKPGVGLAFLAYPEVASALPAKQLWAFLFFLMITILGLDSQVCMLEGLFTALEDAFPTVLRRHKKVSLLFTCIFFFLIGIPMLTYAGAHWLTLVDAYGPSGFALLFVVFFEVVGLAWGFGAERIRQALSNMVGVSPTPLLTILWKYTAPLSALLLFACCVFMYQPLKYPNGREYPLWPETFGFALSLCSMSMIPAYAIYHMFFKSGIPGGPIERFRHGFNPSRWMLTREIENNNEAGAALNLQAPKNLVCSSESEEDRGEEVRAGAVENFAMTELISK